MKTVLQPSLRQRIRFQTLLIAASFTGFLAAVVTIVQQTVPAQQVIAATDNSSNIHFYPAGDNREITISVYSESNQEASLILADIQGSEIENQTHELRYGSNQIHYFMGNNIVSGKYLLQLSTADGTKGTYQLVCN